MPNNAYTHTRRAIKEWIDAVKGKLTTEERAILAMVALLSCYGNYGSLELCRKCPLALWCEFE